MEYRPYLIDTVIDDYDGLFATYNLKYVQTQLVLFIFVIIRHFVKKKYDSCVEELLN
jgi:hypothetical protein